MEQQPYGTNLWFIGHQVRPLKTTGAYALADVVVTPGVPGPPPHHHAAANELYYVLEGPMEFLRGDEWYRVGPGESFLIPKGTVHSFRNNGEQPTRFLTLHDPGEGADHLFLEFGVPVDEPGAFAASISEAVIGEVIACCADHDMHLAGPPPDA